MKHFNNAIKQMESAHEALKTQIASHQAAIQSLRAQEAKVLQGLQALQTLAGTEAKRHYPYTGRAEANKRLLSLMVEGQQYTSAELRALAPDAFPPSKTSTTVTLLGLQNKGWVTSVLLAPSQGFPKGQRSWTKVAGK